MLCVPVPAGSLVERSRVHTPPALSPLSLHPFAPHHHNHHSLSLSSLFHSLLACLVLDLGTGLVPGLQRGGQPVRAKREARELAARRRPVRLRARAREEGRAHQGRLWEWRREDQGAASHLATSSTYCPHSAQRLSSHSPVCFCLSSCGPSFSHVPGTPSSPFLLQPARLPPLVFSVRPGHVDEHAAGPVHARAQAGGSRAAGTHRGGHGRGRRVPN